MAFSLKATAIRCYLVIVMKTVWWIRNIKVLLGKMTLKYGLYGYYERDGLPLTEIINPPGHIQACVDYDDFRYDDVFLLTYPKSGTGFVSDVIYSMYRLKGMLPEGHRGSYTTFCLIPAIPIPGYKTPKQGESPLVNVDKSLSPRVLGSHLPWNIAPQQVRDGKVKTIHCIRNPKDIASSGIPFFKRMGLYTSTWEEFVHNFMAGKTVQGCWFEWIRKWYPYRNNKNMLTLYYEEMIEDLPSAVRNIAEFLKIELSDEQVGAVAKANTFAVRKQKRDFGAAVKLRKGKVGSWKADFTVEQNEMADEWIMNKRRGLDDLKLIFE